MQYWIDKVSHAILIYSSWMQAGLAGMILLWVTVGAARAWRDAARLDAVERSLGDRLMQPFMTELMPRTDAEMRSLNMRLYRAGLSGEHAVRKFVTLRIALLGASLLASLLFQMVMSGFVGFMLILLLFGSIAWIAPDAWIDGRIAARRLRIARILPSVVDLLVLCLDVGLSLDAAFEKVTEEVRAMEPLMSEEAQFMAREMQAGLTFPQALRRMAERVQLEDLTNLSRLVGQATELGASITTALRDYSEQSFQKRLSNMEQHAGKISAWLVLPLSLCFLPAVMLALIGPAVVQLSGVFKSV